MRSFERYRFAISFERECHGVAGFSRHRMGMNSGNHFNPFVREKVLYCVGDVGVFVMKDATVPLDHCDTAAKPSHGLSEFKRDVSAAQDNEVCGDAVEFKRFDMSEWLSLRKSGYLIKLCS